MIVDLADNSWSCENLKWFGKILRSIIYGKIPNQVCYSFSKYIGKLKLYKNVAKGWLKMMLRDLRCCKKYKYMTGRNNTNFYNN